MNNNVMIIFLSNLQRCDKYNVFIAHVLTEHDTHAFFFSTGYFSDFSSLETQQKKKQNMS